MRAFDLINMSVFLSGYLLSLLPVTDPMTQSAAVSATMSITAVNSACQILRYNLGASPDWDLLLCLPVGAGVGLSVGAIRLGLLGLLN